MPKFLRSIFGFHDAEIEQAIGRARAAYVLAMYEYHATPLPTDGCAKLNVCFRQKPPAAAPSLVLGVATIEWPFNLKALLPRLQMHRHGMFLTRRMLHSWPRELILAGGWNAPARPTT